MKAIHLIFFSLIPILVEAQDFSKEALEKMKDEELLTLFGKVSGDSIKAENVVRVYLNRARKEKDTIKMARAYGRLTAISESSKRLNFSDSIIYLTKDLNNKDYPAIGYIFKGLEYYRIGNLKRSTQNYIDAYKLALKNENITQQIFISDKLIGLKSYWGNRREALELQKKRHQLVTKKEYIKEIKTSAIERGGSSFENLYFESALVSMQNFVVCYINLNVLDSASIFLEKGFHKTADYKGYNHDYFYNWFTLASVEIDWYSENYEKAIVNSNKLLSAIDADNNLEIVFDIYFFKGFSLIKLGKYEEGIKYLKKVDSVFEQRHISLLPYHRDLFEELLAYHNSKNDLEMKIKYLNKLLVVDSIFKHNYQFFEPNLIRNYETPQLLKEKEALIADLKQKNIDKSTKIWWVLAFLVVSLIAFIFYFKRQQLYKKRFEHLMLQQELPKSESFETTSHKNEVSSEITKDILNHLKVFEMKREYLSQEISLRNMAKSFGTNHTYLSKVINLEKRKNFSKYISDLRIEYGFQELKVNQKLRKYTVKAIANECGFISAESFSKTFYNKYGIYPSYYVKELEKSNA